MLLQSETKIEPDLRLDPGNNLSIRQVPLHLLRSSKNAIKKLQPVISTTRGD